MTDDKCELTADKRRMTVDKCELTDDKCELTDDKRRMTVDKCELTADKSGLTDDKRTLTDDKSRLTADKRRPTVVNSYQIAENTTCSPIIIIKFSCWRV